MMIVTNNKLLKLFNYYPALVRVQHIEDVCLYTSISQKLHIKTSKIFCAYYARDQSKAGV